MTGRRNLLLAAALLAVGFMSGWLGTGFTAGEPTLPGGEQDPLVSRSYVEERLLQEIESKTKMVVVEVPAGRKLIGYAGTEIIVRGGQATAFDTPQGGLSDVTGGTDLRMGDAAPANHLLIVPRDDGRGILAVTPLFVMVRGTYTIE